MLGEAVCEGSAGEGGVVVRVEREGGFSVAYLFLTWCVLLVWRLCISPSGFLLVSECERRRGVLSLVEERTNSQRAQWSGSVS